jgi:hypothetical protein
MSILASVYGKSAASLREACRRVLNKNSVILDWI